MKTRLFAALVIAMLSLSIIAVFPILPAQATPADSMWVDPPSITLNTGTTSLGDTFNITIYMNITSANVFAYQIALHYPTWLACIASDFTFAAGGPSVFFQGKVEVSSGPQIDTSFLGAHSILASESLKGADKIITPRSASLIWATMKINETATKTQNLTGVFDLTTETAGGNNWVWAPPPPPGNAIPITAYNGLIDYNWAPPATHPKMGIEHDTGFGPSPITVNPTPSTAWPIQYGASPPNATDTSGFTASLYIKNLDPAWGLWNTTFNLNWNNSVIYVSGAPANISITGLWTGSFSYAPGTISFYAENYVGPAVSNVLVATVKFTIGHQGANPPEIISGDTLLTYTNVTFFDAPSPGGNQYITPDPSDQGEVKVLGIIALPLPYLIVVPASIILGPSPVIYSYFTVLIKVVNMSKLWYDVAVQFRLQYNSALIFPVSVTEGDGASGFINDTQWNHQGTGGTFFWSVNNLGDPTFGDHIAVLDLLMPNKTNGKYDQTVFPNTIENPAANATVTTVVFQVLQQNCFGLPDITTYLKIPHFWAPDPDQEFIGLDKVANLPYYIPSADNLNGTVTIKSLNFVGRQIDLYGGAVNDGYGVLVGAPYLQFPAPYGGQGPNHWMDLVFPQSQVYLNANVTYNYWPVQAKDVGFEIEGPYDHVGQNYIPRTGGVFDALFGGNPLKLAATTDTNGIASITFRMPWTCPIPIPPDNLTGIYKVTSTVTIADVVVNDTMLFYYERLVYITSVTTNSYSYIHGQCVKVTVNYQTHAVEYYPALFSVVITDDLMVPFGTALYATTVGGATFCTWKSGTFQVTICIPKWAYAGNGYVHVSVYDKDPTIGGEALAPEFKPDPQINIYPY